MKLHVVVPTIMTNPEQEFNCLDQLVTHFDSAKLDFKIYFVANFDIKEFEDYTPVDSRIIKSVSNLPFSISRAVNSVFEKIEYVDNDILAFIQSDTFFTNSKWIESLLEVVNTPELEPGVLGLRPHKSINIIEAPIDFKGRFNIHPVQWSDGVMLFKGEVYRKVGGFDENYFGDCESQDFCYQALQHGYVNYWCSDDNGYFGYTNRTVAFINKTRFNESEFLRKVTQSREYLKTKWEAK